MPKFELKQAQVDFIGSPEQFPAYIAGVGTGKSTALIAKALLHSQESKDNLGVIVRKQFSDLRNSTIKDFQDYTGLKVNESTHEVRLKNGSTILFIHGDVLDSLKNINCGWFAIEQAEEFADYTAWQFLKMRLRRKVEFRSGFLIGNTNGHNWIYDIYKRQNPPANHELIEATTYDFRDIHAPDYITNLETLPKKLFNRYVMNSWEEAEGLVYDEYLESKHVVEPFEIPSTWEKGFTLDHGFRNPTAVLFYAIDFDGNIYIYNEHYEAGKPVSYHAEKIKEQGFTQGIADPSIFNKTMSRGSVMYSIADEYQEYGISLGPAAKSKEDASIARVNEFFKSDRIKIFRNNVNTIHEIGNWKWKEVKPGLNAKEEPQDLNNHACLHGDTEVLTHSGWTKLSNLDGKSGQVWTPFGWQDYFCFNTGNSELVSLTMNDGFEIIGTPNHPLLSTLGWDTMEYINKGDILYGPDSFERYNSRIEREALLLGRYSLFQTSGKRKDEFASQKSVGIGEWNNQQWNAHTSQGPQQDKQFSKQFNDYDFIQSLCPSYVTRENRNSEAKFKESYFEGPEMAQIKRRERMAFETCKRNGTDSSYISMPTMQETIRVERPEKSFSKILWAKLSKEVSQKKSLKPQSVYNLFVNKARSFYLRNGLVSHNCDALKYLIASRFSPSQKPSNRLEKWSLDWIDKQDEYKASLEQEED